MKREVYIFITPRQNEHVVAPKFGSKKECDSWISRYSKKHNYTLDEVFDVISTEYGLKKDEIKVGMDVKYKTPHAMYLWNEHDTYTTDLKVASQEDDKNYVLSNGEIARWDGEHFMIGEKETILELNK
jgi:hypothetical protein